MASFDNRYLAMFEKQKEKMGVEVNFIGKAKTGNEPDVFQQIGVPGEIRSLVANEGITVNESFLKFSIRDLQELRDVRDEKNFPIKRIENKISVLNYNGESYSIKSIKNNSFNNLVIFILDRTM